MKSEELSAVYRESLDKGWITKPELLRRSVSPMQLSEGLSQLYKDGLTKGCLTGWPNVDELYTVAPGQWTLVTGIPGHGKSEWLDHLMVNLAIRYNTRFSIYSPENNPQTVHLAKLLEKKLCKPFSVGPTERMSSSDIAESMGWMDTHFNFIRPDGDQPALIDEILSECYTWKDLDPGYPMGVVIDPWNELEHCRPQKQSETEYISDTLSRVRRFCRNTKCHLWIVAHPAKLLKDKDGKRGVPSPYDVSGSAHWFNKADNCITVWRDPQQANSETEVHVQKVRFKHIGRAGIADLIYDRVTGRYSPSLRAMNAYQARSK